MANKNPLELFLFTDEPVRDLENDHLALRPFSSMIAAAALTNRGPFNIGVFSGWGQGKTTVLRQAEALIKEQERPSVVTAWVNAWQYEHEAHPIVPLLAIIINEITRTIDARKSVSETENDAISKTFSDLKRALRSIAYGFSAKAGATIPGFANLEIGFVAKDMIDRDEKLSSDRDPLLDQSLYYHAYERLEKFREQLAKSKPEDQPKIIVFIDDLDRCLPSKALHLLESLKLVLAQPGFIFVLGVDRHVIDSFLSKRYHDDFGIQKDMGHGRQYMDKIIQLPLNLPHHQHRFEKYIGELIQGTTTSLPAAFSKLFTDGEAGPAFISALAAGCDRTPRTLIRTLNYLLTDLFLREHEFFNQEEDLFDHAAEFLEFAAVSRITRITFGSEYDRLYRKLVEDNWTCLHLAHWFGKEENIWNATLSDPEWGYCWEGGAEQHKDDLARLEPCRTAIMSSDCLRELFSKELGLRWLKGGAKRQAIEDFIGIREDSNHKKHETSEQIIEAAIRAKLDLLDESIDDEDRMRIFDLDLSGTQVSDLAALKDLPRIRSLDISNTQVRSLNGIRHLVDMKMLTFRDIDIDDLSPLENMSMLSRLYLGGVSVSNLESIKHLVGIERLGLSGTKVRDISQVFPFIGLKRLYIDGTAIKSLVGIECLKVLQLLSLKDCMVEDLAPLVGLRGTLKTILIHNSAVAADVAAIERLKESLPDTKVIAK